MLVDLQPYNGAEENLYQVKDMFAANWVAELELRILLGPALPNELLCPCATATGKRGTGILNPGPSRT